MNDTIAYMIDNSDVLSRGVLTSMHVAARRFNGFEAAPVRNPQAPSGFLNGTTYGNAIYDEKTRDEVHSNLGLFGIFMPNAMERKRIKGKTISVPKRYKNFDGSENDISMLAMIIEPFSINSTSNDDFFQTLWREAKAYGWEPSDFGEFSSLINTKQLVEHYLNAYWSGMVAYAENNKYFSVRGFLASLDDNIRSNAESSTSPSYSAVG